MALGSYSKHLIFLTRRVVSSCELDEDAILLPARSQTQCLLQDAGPRDPLHPRRASRQAFLKVDKLFGRLPLGAQYFTSALLEITVGPPNPGHRDAAGWPMRNRDCIPHATGVRGGGRRATATGKNETPSV